jgi:hypothetical protein
MGSELNECLELMRDRKRARKLALISRPNTGGQAPREIVSVGYFRVAVKGGQF